MPFSLQGANCSEMGCGQYDCCGLPNATIVLKARVWGTCRLGQVLVFAKIRSALGIMRTVISGGGSLAGHLDDFYETLALPVLNGWGLTETSPVLACRRDMPRENVRGTVGLPIPGTAVRVVHPDTLRPVPEGQQVRDSTNQRPA